MLSISKRVVHTYGLQALAKNCRSVSSDRTRVLLRNTSYNDTRPKDEVKKEGYGEKEIFLLHPVDRRTPLPGNTGLAPPSLLFQETIKPLPKSNSVKNDILDAHLSEERQRSALTQLAYAAVENIICSSEMLECVAYECPQLLKKDFTDLFPRLDSYDSLTVLTLCQKTKEDMSQWSEEIELERSNLEECFIIAAQVICSSFRDSGYWADFIHPASGKPFFKTTNSSATLLETDLRYHNFGFTIEDLGCCKVISHHLWGTHAFVGAIFTNAPLNSPEIKNVLNKNSVF